MKKYKFAIAGCGTIGAIHAECINQIDNAELSAVYDANEENSKKLSSVYNCCCYSDLNQMLSNEDIDIVCICTPSGLHAEYGIKCAQAKKHVICEKPIETTIEKAESLIKACEQEGVKLSVISQHRFDKCIVELKRAIDAGELGKLCFGESFTKWYRSREYYESSKWRGTWKLDGGGALINQSIHYIDLLQYLLGPVREVYGVCSSMGHNGIEVEDEALATVRFKNGAIGMIEGNTNAYPGFFTRLDIYGEKASVVVENDNITMWKNRNGTERKTEFINGTAEAYSSASSSRVSNFNSHIQQFKDVIQAIEDDRKPKVDGYEALKPLRIIMAVYESNKTGRPVIFKDC
ncbi:MAG: Gfo/Idh/MocA family oxidoreductase [Bacillota bacterium]|nr:Gfo/Idh/MocA family oxidoreductase [Bacillota bacterium]